MFALLQFGWWTHPIYSKNGDYPNIMKTRIKDISELEKFPNSRLPAFSKQEVELIKGTYDFFGLNHYTTTLISDHEYPLTNSPSHLKDMGIISEQDPKWKPSKASWLKVVPWGFRKLLVWIKENYDNPIVLVTENGYADDGRLEDFDRIFYHKVSIILYAFIIELN